VYGDGSESERPRIKAAQMLLEPLLVELGVIAGFRPLDRALPSDQISLTIMSSALVTGHSEAGNYSFGSE